MAKTTVALTDNQYKEIIQTIRQGFTFRKNGKNVKFESNDRVATALTVEGVLGLRVSDIVNLKLDDIIQDGDRYRLDIVEQKTGKTRRFTVQKDIRSYLMEYAVRNGIKSSEPLFNVTTRSIQKQLKIVADHLGLENIGTHSFRKYFATKVYNESGFNIEVAREIMQHSSSAITQRYISVSRKEIESALSKHAVLI